MNLILDWLSKTFTITMPTTTAEWVGQSFGVLAALCCGAMPLFKKKWQMLLMTAIANLFFALNYMAINEARTGMILNLVAIIQVGITFLHLKKDTDVSVLENILFLFVNLTFAITFLVLKDGWTALGIKNWLEYLPLIAAVFNTLATFQRDEQKTRVLTLINASIYCTYLSILGLLSLLAELLAVITCIVGLIRYRKK